MRLYTGIYIQHSQHLMEQQISDLPPGNLLAKLWVVLIACPVACSIEARLNYETGSSNIFICVRESKEADLLACVRHPLLALADK